MGALLLRSSLLALAALAALLASSHTSVQAEVPLHFKVQSETESVEEGDFKKCSQL